MTKKIVYPQSLRRFVIKHGLQEKLKSIIALLDKDAQDVLNWADKEAARRKNEEKDYRNIPLGRIIYDLVGEEAAIRLIQQNHAHGRLTTKSEIRQRTGQKIEMPLLYRAAGLRHPQEARNLRHNLFHESFLALIKKLFSNVKTSVPKTGRGLSPDLLVKSTNPEWIIAIEYKGYRSLTLLGESELLKGMRYQAAYGTAWLVTSTVKSVKEIYSGVLKSEELVKKGLERLRIVAKRRAYTEEQRENRGIARKGIAHLEKHKDDRLRCRLISEQELIESCREGKPVEGLAVTTGFELIKIFRENGLEKEAENLLRIMKIPTDRLYSETVTSVKLIG